ncbi:MAG: aminotransferase class I/II-fold pyridoxal phosphate-dependent enzyme [Ichthyobacteriaceae bacterium]|nr:aminotransferase class I/II-fold pyridoxal phosphate-dependent enzyme [Ichthyobacteriaceae bacterium]
MISAAKRLGEVKEYYFSIKLAQIKSMNEAGKDVINLGIGSPDTPPHPRVLEAASKSLLLPESHGYQGYKGVDKFRKAIANWYKKTYAVEVNYKSELLPLMGSKEGIMHISMAFLNPGDGVLVPNPGYPTYKSVSDLLQAKIYTYNLEEKRGWYPNFEELEKLDLTKIKIMWVNYPNMPTGADASIRLFRDLVAFGKKHNILIVNDNPYSYVMNKFPMSIMQVPDAREVAIELNSLSKTFNMAGWRVGMVIGHEYYITKILRVKSNMDSGMFLPVQEGAAAALDLDASWYKKMSNLYAERKKVAQRLFNVLGCEYRKHEVGMFVWAKLPNNAKALDVSNIILKEANVFITPGMIFGSNGNNFLRISLCSSSDKIEEAISRIENSDVLSSILKLNNE